MGLHKGQKPNHSKGRGKKGRSGRKTTREEVAAAIELQQIWTLIKPKFLKLAQKGSVRLLSEVFRKKFPDKMEIEDPEMVKQIEKFRQDLKKLFNDPK